MPRYHRTSTGTQRRGAQRSNKPRPGEGRADTRSLFVLSAFVCFPLRGSAAPPALGILLLPRSAHTFMKSKRVQNQNRSIPVARSTETPAQTSVMFTPPDDEGAGGRYSCGPHHFSHTSASLPSPARPPHTHTFMCINAHIHICA